MPDLDLQSVEEWFAALGPGGNACPLPAVRALERDPAMEARLSDLGALLDAAAAADPAALAAALQAGPLRSDLQAVVAQLGAARLLRVLTWPFEAALPDALPVLDALVAGDGPAAAALRSARGAALAWTTLHDLFAPGRVAALRAATLDALEETAP